MCVDADEVRDIVREEITAALAVLIVAADDAPQSYETTETEDTAARVVEEIATATSERLKHNVHCPLRTESRRRLSTVRCINEGWRCA